jgi:hypothetical protein
MRQYTVKGIWENTEGPPMRGWLATHKAARVLRHNWCGTTDIHPAELTQKRTREHQCPPVKSCTTLALVEGVARSPDDRGAVDVVAEAQVTANETDKSGVQELSGDTQADLTKRSTRVVEIGTVVSAPPAAAAAENEDVALPLNLCQMLPVTNGCNATDGLARKAVPMRTPDVQPRTPAAP